MRHVLSHGHFFELCAWSAFLVVMAGCGYDGDAPARGDLSFPIAATLTADANYLVVVNSNFDLRYSSGSVHSYDLGVLEDGIVACTQSEGCAFFDGDGSHPRATLLPGLLRSEVLIPSYGDGIRLSVDGDRVYIPNRSDGSLSHIDLSDGELGCAGGRTCSGAFLNVEPSQRLIDSGASTDFPLDPVDVITGKMSDLGNLGEGAEGNYLLTIHRTGDLALMQESNGAPQLLSRLVDAVPSTLQEVDFHAPSKTFWAASSSGQLIRFGIAVDAASVSGEGGQLPATLYAQDGVFVDNLPRQSGGNDFRDLQFHPTDPDTLFVLSRQPPALHTLAVGAPNTQPTTLQTVAVGGGASRFSIAEFATVNGSRMLAFVACYDDRSIYIVDLERGGVNVLRGVAGPFEVIPDVARKRIYVIDFRLSVVSVFDLSPLLDCFNGMGDAECGPQKIATIGEIRPVQELK